MNSLKKSLSINSRRSSASSGVSIISEASPKTDWTSIYVGAAFAFIGSVQFNIFFASLLPYLEKNDPKGDQTFFGYIVAAYSLGQLIASPLVGYWSNKIKQIKIPVQTGLTFMLLGNIFHICLVLFPSNSRRWIMMLGRFLTGVGSSNTLLLKAYATSASTTKDRSQAIAYITGGMAIGTTMGPAFQAMFSGLSYPGLRIFSNVYFNIYTAPAFLACLINILGMIVLYFFFHESYAGVIDDQKNNSKRDNTKLPPFDMLAVIIMNFTRFTQMFVQTNMETVSTSFSQIMFFWTATEAVKYGSIAQGVLGAFSFIVYFLYISLKLNRYMKFRIALQISMVALFIFHLLTFAWPFLPESIHTYNVTDEIIASKDELPGCNINKYSWCPNVKAVNQWVYIISYPVIIGIAFPIINVAMNTLYSMIIGPRRQGTMQGVMQVSGAVSRIIGPVTVGTLYQSSGPYYAWGIEFIVIFLNLLLLMIFHKRLIPLQIPNDTKGIVNKTLEDGDASGDEGGNSLQRVSDIRQEPITGTK
ncbi:Major facilitator superfamily and Major facilitator superfamily domain, general substrate transporter and Major facilitator superfamily domain-containing protein [Strongyloides ratti]|uniref:Major facilitator superfamily and Major facilitator superfamily domain, general substrate transporter and Major facilitator superfamily domain-containing protein n=1 Tax=Strongyloides ratti TaxID=34506 RepID=A0A090LH74_STRRB|nr:Major facilitator superfamily and Major facilitator superfamily domain, general substrate transporter and Major facilitator superfamily domain-containing protein [Strongyloides ratti]CEF66825.1 Major facilitator superfamily and Major facilitator superfamily domain, general substrate transporter and Major facilitator superfamily domain-containing protein [Strongyloides ratti]